MRTILKINIFHPVCGIGWPRRIRIICAGILAAFILCRGEAALAVVSGHDFTRYQVILDKKPFGEVTPSEVAPLQAALGDTISKELEMKSIVDDGTGMRIGLLDKKTNKNISLGVGENYEGIQLVSVNYDNEEAVLKKGSETAVVKLHPDKDKDKMVPVPGAVPAGMAEAPFQTPNPFAAAQESSPAVRKPFFADLKKRRMTPFQPVGTNVLPFQAKPLDSFFKVSTGAFPNAQSPFGPFQAPQGSASPGGFQQLMTGGSNVPNPFAPVSPAGGQVNPPNPNARIDGKGATIDQLMQDQTQPVVNQFPANGEPPAEEVTQ